MREFRIINADVLEGLRGLPSESVHCCVTSPPYWGLRDYGTGTWEGGEPDCEHRSPTMRDGRNEDRAQLAGSAATNAAQLLLAHRSACGKCGAVKVDKQLGLERTPEEYTARMVEVFAEVLRVLRADGTCWMNLGDCYNSVNGFHRGEKYMDGGVPRTMEYPDRSGCGLKPKDLVGIPWRVAFALQADGWYLRSDIIWHKPNPMPESVTDRPTKAHEYLFLLTKSERYAYDAASIKEPITSLHSIARNKSTPRNFGASGEHNGCRTDRGRFADIETEDGRNKRTVWSIATEPYAEAHFAVMPTQLVEPCVMAGCPEGGTVLDPFAGSGTVGVVALRHARDFIGIELNPVYAEMARNRIMDDAPMFNSEVA